MAKKGDLGFQILSRVARNGSGWLPDMQIHSPPRPELSLHFPALPFPHPPPPTSKLVVCCFQQPCRVEKPCYISVVDTFPKSILSHAQGGQTSASFGCALCSGVLGVSPTPLGMGVPSLQKRKHMCPEDHGPHGKRLARAAAS